MAIPRLNPDPRRRTVSCLSVATGGLLTFAIVLGSLATLQATGGYDDSPPVTLSYFIDRLPAKPPALIFEETFNGPTSATKPTDFKAALLSLAGECEKNASPVTLIATTDKLLVQARLKPTEAAALCNLLDDVRDLFAAPTPVPGKLAAGYIRWRVEHAGWFHLTSWDDKKPEPTPYADEDATKRSLETREQTLDKRAKDPLEGPLRVHWIYLRGACVYPKGGVKQFQQIVDSYPDHPRAEVARFMLARGKLAASRSHSGAYAEPTPDEAAAAKSDRAAARALFEDYLKRYPQGRFVADVPGWLGALAFDDADYLGALDQYIRQADVLGHPEVLKSAGFMCERCLSRLASADDEAALDQVALHPKLAMSLIYLLVNSSEANNYDGVYDSPAQVARWRAALLPRLATAVAANKDAYTGHGWQGRYLAMLAQAASGTGDQTKALALCDLDKTLLVGSDDLAFIRLVALARARRLPEAITAAGDFARQFPRSPLAPGAALRRVLALVDNHQAGTALVELYRLRATLEDEAKRKGESTGGYESGANYPSEDGDLSSADSVLSSDTSGAEGAAMSQITDTLLNFAPLPELAVALLPAEAKQSGVLDGADGANLRAVLVQRWLSEEENFAEARKFATPAQWSVAAAAVEKLAVEAASAPAGEARATAYLRLADGWAAARGKLLFAPLETGKTRDEVDDVSRRTNGLALGLDTDRINGALSSRDEWRHAFDWWQKAADAAPDRSPIRAKALWAALRAMPSMTLASPYTFSRAGETDASGQSRRLYDRLRRECPDSREAREFAVYYDLAPPLKKADGNTNGTNNDGDDKKAPDFDLSAASADESLPYGEPEYRWDPRDEYGMLIPDESDQADPEHDKVAPALQERILALNKTEFTANPARMAKEVAVVRAKFKDLRRQPGDYYLINFADDLNDFLQEPAAKLTPAAVKRYVELRTECLSVEDWGSWPGERGLPAVPGATPETLNETVLAHIRAAYRAPEMAACKDYLDFLALAVVANENIEVPIPGEMQDAKDSDEPGKKEPVTYTSRDYPKLAKLAEGFLKDHPQSRKREAARLLYARALYAASRPHVVEKFAIWPESKHFENGKIIITHRQQAFDARQIGAALNAYDREFPHGRYEADIRNLRGLLAWRTQDWPLAIELTLRTLADEGDAVLREEAARRLDNIFVDGLTDETERQRCLTAIKSRPVAAERLRKFLPDSGYPLRLLQSWLQAQM